MRDVETALRARTQADVRFDAASRALYATDASNYRQVPVGVVIPRTVDDVVTTVAICREHDLPVLSRGGGTSLCGQCCNAAVVIDFSAHLNRIIEIDPARKVARVQPGVVLDELRRAAARHGLTFAPDPSTHNHNTLGGMIGNNSCGPHSVMGGKTQENIVALDVLLYDGTRMHAGEVDDACFAALQQAGGRIAEIHAELRALGAQYGDEIRARFPDIPRRVSGYNLDALLPGQPMHVAQALVGSEGTCVVVLEATVRLVDNPAHRALLVLGYPSVYDAGDHVCTVMQHGPIALEGMDDDLVHDMRASGLRVDELALLPSGAGWLLVEFGGDTPAQAAQHAQAAMQALSASPDAPTMALYTDPDEQHQVWRIREAGLGATAHVPNKHLTWEGWEDAAVPPERLGEYLRRFRALLDQHGYEADLYGHFGQGCVHTRINFDLVTAQGIARFRRFIDDAAQLAVSMGGAISGEHGDGQSKAALLPLMYGPRLMTAFRAFKHIWDPHNRMNPGKVVDAYAPDENLRLGTRYDTPDLDTHFRYPDDAGSFTHALLRCVGVGECRKQEGLMCPSYMATGDEMHSTRGRARLLFEMAEGDVLKDGWRNESVKQALDLCLSCKGCKRECPVSVDMATYKAEFMAHHYAGRLRPLTAHAFGHIDRWSRWAAHAPRLANYLSQHEPTASWLKRLVGIAPQRRLPTFAPLPFTTAHRAHRLPGHRQGQRVILWADTFNNHFHPDTLTSAWRVLTQLGCDVVVPPQPLCCGRPLYEFGLLDEARAKLKQVLQALDADIRAGTPVIGLEPACMSVFKDELHALMPFNQQARRLRQQAQMLGDFVAARLDSGVDTGWTPLHRQALVHAHCHHRAVLGLDAEQALLQRLGLDVNLLDAGCCGMAGSFGFERDKYEVSQRCAERVLLPAIRSAPADTLVIANGFSCREQISQAGLGLPMHLAEVLALAAGGRHDRRL